MTRNVLVYLAIVGGIVAFSALFLVLFGNSVTLECFREANRDPDCRITRKFLGQIQLLQREVQDVRGVQVDEDCDDGCSYRAILLTSSGRSVPVNEVYTDYGIVERQVHAIDGYLSGTEPSFLYVEPTPWWVVIMIVFMDAVGLAVVVGTFLRNAQARDA